MEIPVIEWIIRNRLVQGQPQGQTASVWYNILHQYFKASDGFATGPEMLVNDNNQADLFTAHSVLDTRTDEKKIFLVACRAPGLDRQDGIWEQGLDQLERYLGNIHGTYRKFGAIAIGKVVRFYEWKNGAVADFGDGSQFYLDGQCQSVSQHLNYFRQNS
jgi:hypothetical protein